MRELSIIIYCHTLKWWLAQFHNSFVISQQSDIGYIEKNWTELRKQIQCRISLVFIVIVIIITKDKISLQ